MLIIQIYMLTLREGLAIGDDNEIQWLDRFLFRLTFEPTPFLTIRRLQLSKIIIQDIVEPGRGRRSTAWQYFLKNLGHFVGSLGVRVNKHHKKGDKKSRP